MNEFPVPAQDRPFKFEKFAEFYSTSAKELTSAPHGEDDIEQSYRRYLNLVELTDCTQHQLIFKLTHPQRKLTYTFNPIVW